MSAEFKPCMHDHVGFIEAGELGNGAFSARAVCILPACQAAASRDAHTFTGKPAKPMVTFVEYRRMKADAS